jgi:DNA-directed RNA polymerase subunit M/transcription elongation factor TFIIS
MELIDQAGEWRRLAEHYRQMTDGELLDLARQRSALTDAAQQALAQEISSRKLTIPSEEPPPLPEPPPDVPDDTVDPYAKERELIEIATLWSLRDALRLQYLLDIAGIPFYLGPQKATRVDPASNFAGGVAVKIMRVGWPWAWQAMQNYFPKDEPPEEKVDWERFKVEVHCPRCRSTDVIFEQLTRQLKGADGKPSSKFKWRCDSCGNEWQDDGVGTG